MTTLAPAPEWAPRVWHDNQHIYIQFPSGLVQRFAYTEGGVSRLLKLIPKVQDQPGWLSGSQNIFNKLTGPKIVAIARKRKGTKFVKENVRLSDAQKAQIDELIKDMKEKER